MVIRVAAGDRDLLGPDREGEGRAVGAEVVGRVRRVDRLDDQVLDVHGRVRRTPRDPGVVAQDDARDPGEADAGDVERAGLARRSRNGGR